MPKMRQRTADPYREIRGESGAAVLALFGVSKVSNDAESLKCRGELEIVFCPLLCPKLQRDRVWAGELNVIPPYENHDIPGPDKYRVGTSALRQLPA